MVYPKTSQNLASKSSRKVLDLQALPSLPSAWRVVSGCWMCPLQASAGDIGRHVFQILEDQLSCFVAIVAMLSSFDYL